MIDDPAGQGEDAAIPTILRTFSPMIRTLAASFGLALLLIAGPVLATEIPKEQLDSDFKSCMQSCSQNYDKNKSTGFCNCANDGAKAQFSYEEYQKLAADLNAANLANEDSLNKLKSIASSCKTKFLQP
jgi:protein-disulfide isomerase-like protein with CxxC motif